MKTNIFVNGSDSRESLVFGALLSSFQHYFGLPGFSSYHLLFKQEFFTEFIMFTLGTG